MRHVAALVAVCACWTASGCASGLLQTGIADQLITAASQADAATAPVPQPYSARLVRDNPDADLAQVNVEWTSDAAEPAQEQAAAASDAGDEESPNEQPPVEQFVVDESPAEESNVALAAYSEEPAAYAEEVARPDEISLDAVTTADDISDPDALTRKVADVPLGIRPPPGELPPDLAATAFAREAPADQALANRMPATTVVSWTPWTLCYRPLYFEQVQLERYGNNIGVLQPGVDGAHFFLGVGLIPCKIASRYPTSCICSNGFSQCGDVPPPGYVPDRLYLPGLLIEGATVAGIVLALP